ncbi:hypothetical protein JW935_07340, partial [candidate division KSB1 bacterium]|nr:hypothetical protein [candidate division KSB1 bacterium]
MLAVLARPGYSHTAYPGNISVMGGRCDAPALDICQNFKITYIWQKEVRRTGSIPPETEVLH